MRTTVVDVSAKLMVTNGIVQINENGMAGQSIHSWLKHHMEQHPAGRYELVIGNNATIDLMAGEASRSDLNVAISQQFDRERMNFGEELRVRLITTSSVAQAVPKQGRAAISEGGASAPAERDVWMVTRLSKPQLEAIVEQSLAIEPWRVVVAYCELQRRLGTIEPKLVNSLMILAKTKQFDETGLFISAELNGLGHKDYMSLLARINKLDIRPTPEVRPSSSANGPIPDGAPGAQAFSNSQDTSNQVPYVELGFGLVTASWLLVWSIDDPDNVSWMIAAVIASLLGGLLCAIGKRWVLLLLCAVHAFLIFDQYQKLKKAVNFQHNMEQELRRATEQMERQQREWNQRFNNYN